MAVHPPAEPGGERVSAATTPQVSPSFDGAHAGERDAALAPAAQGAPTERGATGRTGWRLWPETLRWRLILTYALALAVIMLVIGVALNALVARALYATEFSFFQSEAVAAISATQPRFDSLTLGRNASCANALPYQVAFEQAIAQPITASHPGTIEGVYLLDADGRTVAPLSATAGTRALRYLSMPRLAALEKRASSAFINAASSSGSQQLANVGYLVNTHASHYGVELIALRYPTVSPCKARAGTQATALGYVEIVTTFTRTRLALATVRLTLIVVMALAFALGLLIGAPLTAAALRPLSRVTQAARRVAEGDLTQRTRLGHTDDEIGQLGATFDTMVTRIQAAFGARQRSEERMRQFIADASHELRTPLTSIRGYVDVLLRGAKDDPATAEQVLLATRREAERMSRLVNDLLTLARLDTGRPLDLRPLDLQALAGECVDQARILAGQREVMMRTDGRGRLMVMGDADRLKQVILGLLDNALNYGRQTPDGWARVSVGRREGQAIVMIDDNGPGIAAEDAPRVFERFYRAERAGRGRRASDAPAVEGQASGETIMPRAEGSGLGLAIAKAIAEAHGGSLTLESAPGEGAAFTLTLPLTDLARSPTPGPRPGPRPDA